MDRRYFKKQTIEQLDILTKWCEAHDIQFSAAESNVITSAMGEFAEKQALTIQNVSKCCVCNVNEGTLKDDHLYCKECFQ